MSDLTQDYPPSQYSEDHKAAPYDLYGCRIGYGKVSGKLILPVAESTTSTGKVAADVALVYAPIGTKTVNWEVSRKSEPPQLPAVEENSNQVLINQIIQPEAVTVAADGKTEVYTIRGSYTYANLKPLDQTDELKMPTIPPLALDEAAITPDNYDRGVT